MRFATSRIIRNNFWIYSIWNVEFPHKNLVMDYNWGLLSSYWGHIRLHLQRSDVSLWESKHLTKIRLSLSTWYSKFTLKIKRYGERLHSNHEKNSGSKIGCYISCQWDKLCGQLLLYRMFWYIHGHYKTGPGWNPFRNALFDFNRCLLAFHNMKYW